jgi:hypothetical protein
MSDHERPKSPAPTPAAKPASSGRVQFDDRGQAVWEWAVKTGMFDRNASTQRIQKLLEQQAGLEIVDSEATPKAEAESRMGEAPARRASGAAASSGAARPAAARSPTTPARPGDASAAKPAALPDRAGGFNPYERAQPNRPGAKPREPQGRDPYDSGPAKQPERVSFDPYDRTPRK